MKLKSINKIPINIDNSLRIQDIVPLSLEGLKLRHLAKPVEELIRRHTELISQLSKETVVSPKSELDALMSMLLTVQQQRIEALFYSNLHISTNIGRLSGSFIMLIIGNSECLLTIVCNPNWSHHYNAKIGKLNWFHWT